MADNKNFHEIMGRINIGNKKIAIIDVVGTIFGAILITKVTGIDYIYTIPGMFAIGHVAHIVANVKTEFNIKNNNTTNTCQKKINEQIN